MNLSEIDDAIRAWAKITQFVRVIFADQNILYLDILVVESNLMYILQSIQNGVRNLKQFLFGESFIFSRC